MALGKAIVGYSGTVATTAIVTLAENIDLTNYGYIQYNGTKYTSATSFTVNVGDTVTVYAGVTSGNGTSKITLNGEVVATKTGGASTYSLIITGDATISYTWEQAAFGYWVTITMDVPAPFAHDITKGKVLIDGVAYDITQGKTLVDGVAYDIGGNATPDMKELWADAQLLGIGGVNSSRRLRGEISNITASDSQVYILFFAAGGIALYTVGGTNSSGSFIPTDDITLIYIQNFYTTELITLNDKAVQSANMYYGCTLVAVSFPSYTVDQVTSAFNNLTYVDGSGLNSSTQRNLAISVENEQASNVMFLATGAALKVYLPPLDSTTSPAPYAWSSGGSYNLGHPAGASAKYWYAITSTGWLASLYGASLIAYKEG